MADAQLAYHIVNKTVTATGLSLGGADKDNYILSAATAADTADITAKSVSPVIVANDKTYDGTTAATLSSQSVTGVIAPDAVTLVRDERKGNPLDVRALA